MLKSTLDTNDSVIISTQNVLNVSDLRKKAGQKPTEELFDALSSVLTNLEEPATQVSEKCVKLTRKDNDLLEKVGEHERSHIKIGAKLFLNHHSAKNMTTAIDNLFKTLNIDYLDNLILAYHPKAEVGAQNGLANGAEVKEGVIEWGTGEENALGNLKNLWKLLEGYASEKKIGQLGIADVPVEVLKEIYHSSTVHPTITQINLSACCVVPPALQEFCNSNDIQLLTHSDPQQIITQSSLQELGIANFHPTFTVRYQVHIKCRGVIAAKGFLVAIEKN